MFLNLFLTFTTLWANSANDKLMVLLLLFLFVCFFVFFVYCFFVVGFCFLFFVAFFPENRL